MAEIEHLAKNVNTLEQIKGPIVPCGIHRVVAPVAHGTIIVSVIMFQPTQDEARE